MKYYAILTALAAAAILPAQDEPSEIHTRQLWDLNLQKQRVEAKKTPAKPRPAPPATPDNAYIGLTLWRYRVSRTGDAATVRMLVHEPDSDKDQEWTPERSVADAPLQVGDKVRLSIESARQGYLYVIDREQYADGSFGEGQMIFPIRKIRHGDNWVYAGLVVDIPGSGEGFFRVQRNRKDQVAEELTILVAPKPIDGVQIGPKALPVAKEQLAAWKKSWGASVKKLEERDQVGKAYTPAEKEAAEKQTPLTDTDPLPQTMFEVKSEPGKPLMITVPLRIQ